MTTPNPNPNPDAAAGDWIEAVLQTQRLQPMADDGFTARVMQQIAPAPILAQQQAMARNRQQIRRFEQFTLLGALAGSAIAFFGGSWPSSEDVAAAIAALVELQPVSTAALLPWLASLCSAAVLALALNQA